MFTRKEYLLLVLLLFFASFHAASVIGSAYIYAPAVLLNQNQGTITKISLNVTKGTGIINITGASSIGDATTQSAYTAVAYATSYLNMNASKYNFFFSFNNNTTSVSGPSGGLALTLLTISALSNKPLLHSFTATGTISLNGSVGQIGGANDKSAAAKAAGLRFILAPYAANASFENLVYYITQQEIGIPVVEVANVTQALPYAYGTLTPRASNYSLYQNYYTGSLSQPNASCSNNCSSSQFMLLSNATFALTRNSINNLGSEYTPIKPGLMNVLNNYIQLSGKGYLYTGANLAFLEYINTFVLANSKHISKGNATTIISNVSAYCSSLVAPQMTTRNYEYVIGGELRQAWGNATISQAQLTLSASQTNDDILQSIYQAGNSYAWCFGAAEMYNISNGLGGANVTTSQSIASIVRVKIQEAQKYRSNMYLQSAISEYSAGNYAAALYNAVYATVIYNSSVNSNHTQQQATQFVNSNLTNSTYGVWPSQFLAQSRFYLAEGALQTNRSKANGYFGSAYSTGMLAQRLGNANRAIANSFVPANFTSPFGAGTPATLSGIQSQLNDIYILLFVVIALLFGIFILLLVIIVSDKRRQK